MPSSSLAWLIEQGCKRIRLHCTVLGCKRSGEADPAVLSAQFGEEVTLVQIERAAVCQHCGTKGKCWSEPIIIYAPSMGLGSNAFPDPPKEGRRTPGVQAG